MDSQPTSYPTFTPGDHEAFMELALSQARKSPPAANKFCVGAVLADADTGAVLSTGYSLEYPRDYYEGDPGTTHAEQCCFIKIADSHGIPEQRIGDVLPPNTVLYTTMEPCSERLSGNMTCTARILRLKGAIKTVYVGIREPGTFIAHNDGQARLEAGGVKVVFPVEHWRAKITGHEGLGPEIWTRLNRSRVFLPGTLNLSCGEESPEELGVWAVSEAIRQFH